MPMPTTRIPGLFLLELALLGLALLLACRLPAQDPGPAPDYSREVRPILAKNCFACHGPDEVHRKAKLRLDVAGQAELEEVLARIVHADPDERMPPKDSGKSLDPAEIEILRRWIEAGAPYAKHWAFVPPAPVVLPEGDAAHPIDRFIRARLPAGLRPAPRADKRSLIRRVSLDLIGLPPTPEELQDFLADDRPEAYARLVDRLLASPRYGERWARRFLDLARYADSNGYEKDRSRSMWPYRDQVIRAINADQPYDDFVVEQIAGDMLPDPSPRQLIATGFHRNTMLNEEGGIDPLEYRFYAMTDRMATTGSAFLGLSLGCAQCHTHKFDPITHRDYFRLMAFLDNADEPDYVVPDARADARDAQRRREAEKLLEGLAANWPADAPPLDQEFASWLEEQREQTADWQRLELTRAESNLPILQEEDGGVIFVRGDTTKHDTYQLRFGAADHPIQALRLEVLPDERLPAGGPGMTYYEGRKGDFFLNEFRVRRGGHSVAIAQAAVSYSKNRFGKAAGAAVLHDGDFQTGWSVDGKAGARNVAVLVLAEPIPAGQAFAVEMHFGRHYASSLGKFRLSATSDARGGAAVAHPAAIEGLLRRPAADLSESDREVLRRVFLLGSARLKKPAAAIQALLRKSVRPHTAILRERPEQHRRKTHRHHRGEWLQAREVVQPGVPEALHPLGEDQPRNRLGFARWLVDPRNPLFARVGVNRHWAAFFGRGIVTTLDDFGAQGAWPSHPQLLDWLARRFVDLGYSRKRLHRLIVTSQTYQQSSTLGADARRLDPGNRWLARAPRFRMEAEVIRDAALRAAGLLSAKMFGPPVRPPQPRSVTAISYGNAGWPVSKGEDRYRRSIYTYVKRTAPFAFTQTFDAPSGESCIARRDVSNTALQALSLLNDPMMLEIAQAFGRRLADTHQGDDAATLAEGWRRVLARRPDPEETRTMQAFISRQRDRYAADPALAQQAAPGRKGTTAIETAVWTSVARALLSLDETLTRN